MEKILNNNYVFLGLKDFSFWNFSIDLHIAILKIEAKTILNICSIITVLNYRQSF
jgi:hypothetical protein